jgi:flagellin-like hook-associated protein FlgL
MAKPKTYALSPLYKAAGTNQTTLLKVFKDLKIVPIQEMKIGKSTYRLFGQDAMDAALAWREAQNAPPVVEPAPTPFTDVLGSTLLSDVRVLSQKIHVMHEETGTGMRYLNDKLDQLLAQVSALNAEMGVSSQVLNGVACAPADDKPAS